MLASCTGSEVRRNFPVGQNIKILFSGPCVIHLRSCLSLYILRSCTCAQCPDHSWQHKSQGRKEAALLSPFLSTCDRPPGPRVQTEPFVSGYKKALLKVNCAEVSLPYSMYRVWLFSFLLKSIYFSLFFFSFAISSVNLVLFSNVVFNFYTFRDFPDFLLF